MRHPLWIARGQCVEPFGAGEPYRPVLEAVGRLGRGPRGAEVVAVLEAQAPTWLAQLPGLIGPAALEALQRRLAGATRERMLRELAEALEVLTVQQPLVLVLEDLNWSDPSTLELLAVVGRRREPARLFLLGTYRPSEGRPRGHPLAAVLHELQLHGHSMELPVTGLTEDAIAAYLTHRVPGLRCVDILARLVHQHTEGHPLFMATLVESWLTAGVLLEHDGAWRLPGGVAVLHDQVPDSLRQMIEGQLDRLSAAEQRVLEVASVAGVEFMAAAVAAGLAQAVERVDEACAALARCGQWLRAVGEQRWPDGTVAGSYRFGHALYQQVLYRRVAAARRVRLHQRIGARVEVGYAMEAGTRAAELAMHFARGQDPARAVQYLRQAGEHAARRAAYLEAVAHLTQGLELLGTLPNTPARAQQELDIQIARGRALQFTKGYAAPEVEAAYHRARELAQHVQEPRQLLRMVEGLVSFSLLRGALRTARELGEEMLRLAQRVGDPGGLGNSHMMLGNVLFACGALDAARTHLEQGLACYTPQPPHTHGFPTSSRLEVFGLSRLALVLWHLGYPDQALQRNQTALTRAHALAHPVILVAALINAAQLHWRCQEAQRTDEHAEAALVLAHEQGFALRVAEAAMLRGWARVVQGQGEAGIAQVRQGLAAYRATGAEISVGYLVLLAEALRQGGQSEAGLRVIGEALALEDSRGEGQWAAEVSRCKGELLWTCAAAHQTEAETCFQQALAMARRQQARSWELRATVSLSRLWQRQGKCVEARALLALIYGWFTEGFDTTDLQEAKALLVALEGEHG